MEYTTGLAMARLLGENQAKLIDAKKQDRFAVGDGRKVREHAEECVKQIVALGDTPLTAAVRDGIIVAFCVGFEDYRKKQKAIAEDIARILGSMPDD